MKNIKAAIEAKKEYLKNKSVDFTQKIKEFGFNNTEEFAYEEAVFFIKNTKFDIEKISDIINEKNKGIDEINQKKNKIFIVIPDDTYIWWNGKTEFNKEYCDLNKLKIVYQPYNGGVICTNKEDLCVAFIAYDMPNITKFVLLDNICKWINNNISNKAYVSGNDILVDNKKVASYGHSVFENGMSIITLQISFKIDMDIINNVCIKKKEKEPTGLKEYNKNISRDSLINEVVSWLN